MPGLIVLSSFITLDSVIQNYVPSDNYQSNKEKKFWEENQKEPEDEKKCDL